MSLVLYKYIIDKLSPSIEGDDIKEVEWLRRKVASMKGRMTMEDLLEYEKDRGGKVISVKSDSEGVIEYRMEVGSSVRPEKDPNAPDWFHFWEGSAILIAILLLFGILFVKG